MPSPSQQSIQEITQRFFNIVQERISDITRNGKHKEAWSNNSSKRIDYQEERSILSPHYRPFIWGIGTAITLFATFRISKYTGSLRKTSTGYRFENLGRNRTKSDALSDLTSIPMDIFLSLTMGVSAALFLTDEQKLKEDLVRVPLVSGRSLVAQEFCKDFIKEYQSIPSDIWNSRQAMENDAMQQIKKFVDNCEKRQRLMDIRLKQQALDPIDAEYIPSSGVLDQLELYESNKK